MPCGPDRSARVQVGYSIRRGQATSAARREGFVRRTLRNIDANGWPLVGFDIGCPYHFAPLLGLVGDKLTEVAGRARKDAAAEVGKPRLDLGIGETSVDLLV